MDPDQEETAVVEKLLLTASRKFHNLRPSRYSHILRFCKMYLFEIKPNEDD